MNRRTVVNSILIFSPNLTSLMKVTPLKCKLKITIVKTSPQMENWWAIMYIVQKIDTRAVRC